MNFLFLLNGALVVLAAGLLLLPFIMNFASFCKGQGGRQGKSENNSGETDLACVITAYNNLDLALFATDSLMKQNYKNYHIYIVADACEIPNDIPLSSKLTILKPEKDLRSKVKSMKYAIDHFIREHDAVAIFDPDNLAHPDFLKECNKSIRAGFKAVQGKRVAKNLDSKMACLDAMGEIYYNFTTKKVPFNLGSSAIIAGSGMILETDLFKEFFEVPYIKKNLDGVIPGEDKILHYHVVSRDNRIAFVENAILYDEKVSNADMVKNQRTRWINSYILNLSNAANLFFRGTISFNLNKFLSGIITLYPPLFILVLFSGLLAVVNIFITPYYTVILFLSLIIFVLNFMLVLNITNAPEKIWAAFWSIPIFMANQVLALLNIRKSNKEFLTTRNDKKMSLEDVAKNS